MAEIAVVGPGAVGCIVAAWLAQRDTHNVTLCARSPLTDLLIETPGGPITASPPVLIDPHEAKPSRWVLVATKAYDVLSIKGWLDRLVGKDSQVVVLQNGVEHRERFADLVPPDQVIPAVVDIPANRSAPGRVKQLVYGTIVVPSGADGEGFVSLFAATLIAVSTDPDFHSRMWQKLCLNSAGAVSALTLAATGPPWSSGLEEIVRALVEECAAVARAEGAVVPQEIIESIVASAAKAQPSGGRNSMEADRLAGRPMEIDARNGAIVRFGRKHGIATPMNELFVTLLMASGSPRVQLTPAVRRAGPNSRRSAPPPRTGSPRHPAQERVPR